MVGPHEVLNALHAKCNAKPMAMDLSLGEVMRLCDFAVDEMVLCQMLSDQKNSEAVGRIK